MRTAYLMEKVKANEAEVMKQVMTRTRTLTLTPTPTLTVTVTLSLTLILTLTPSLTLTLTLTPRSPSGRHRRASTRPGGWRRWSCRASTPRTCSGASECARYLTHDDPLRESTGRVVECGEG